MNNTARPDIYDRMARIISLLFHPLFMPVYGLVFLLNAPTFLRYLPVEAKKILMFVLVINNVMIPMGLLMFFRYRHLISSYIIDDRNERIMPLLTTSILYCTTSFIIFRFQVPFFIKSFIFATSVVSIILSMINFWWKISIHSAAAGALTATVLMLSFKMHTDLLWYLVAIILISGVVISSRLRLNSHEPSQAWAGYATGFLGIVLFILLI
jgi:hypothetical protein